MHGAQLSLVPEPRRTNPALGRMMWIGDAIAEDPSPGILDFRDAMAEAFRSGPTAFASPELQRLALAALPDEVPAISLYQPYAGLVAAVGKGYPPWVAGLKSLETRRFQRRKLGPLVICSTRIGDGDASIALEHRIPAWARPLCDRNGVTMALAEVIGCRPLVPEDEPLSWYFAPGRWAWELAWVRPMMPVPVRGSQGIFRLPKVLVLEALATDGAGR